jgi:hypothetical protein
MELAVSGQVALRQVEAGGGSDSYIRQVDAQAKLRWKGDVPQFMLGGAGGSAGAPIMPVVLPLQPTAAAERP